MGHIRIRQDTSANWASVNPVLQQGEFGLATDTRELKLGDGSSTWTALDVISGGVGDATTAHKGIVKLAGDLAGTATAPTVPGLLSKADDTSVVHLTGTETVNGHKTFTVPPTVPAPVNPTDAATKDYVDSNSGGGSVDTTLLVHKAGTETITGAKTFTSAPTVPDPVAGTDASSKQYVDGLVAARALDAAVMHLSGAETVSGAKTFSTPPTLTRAPSSGTDATNKSYVDNAVAGAGGSGNAFTALGWLKVNLTASTQAQATANSNAIALANSAALQAAHDSAPAQTPLYIQPVDAGSSLAYYFGQTVTFTRDGIHLVGGAGSSRSSAGGSSTGGSTLKDVPGFVGPAIIVKDGTSAANMQNILMIANTTKTCLLDNGVNSSYLDCTWVGGTEAAFDTRNGVAAPYNLTMTGNGGSGQSGRRINITGCNASGSGGTGSVTIYFGLDNVIVGGRYTSGTKVFNGSGIVAAGVHFTGGGPNLDFQDVRNTLVGCQIDGGGGSVALVRFQSGPCVMADCLYYQSTGSGPSIPLFLITASTGPKIFGGFLSDNGDQTPFSSITKYTGAGNPSSTVIENLAGITTGRAAQLWDASGPPGKYSVSYNGTWQSSDLQSANRLSEIAAAGASAQSAARANLGITTAGGAAQSNPPVTPTLNKLASVSFDPAMRSGNGAAVGTGVNQLIDGTLYLTKLIHSTASITGVARDFSTGWSGAGGSGAPTMLALPVYASDGNQLSLLGVVNLVDLNNFAQGAVIHGLVNGSPINWSLPNPWTTVYVGLVYSGYAAGMTGAVRVPAGQGNGANDWLTAGVDELRFAIGATGVTSLAAIPSSILVSTLTGPPPALAHPPLVGLRS